MKKILGLFLCAGFMWSDVTSFAAQSNEIYPADFDYDVSVKERSDPYDVTFTIANTSYKTNNNVLWFASPQFEGFSGAIQDDLSGILTAKGLSVRGPYESYDFIPFQDKKAIDLLLVPTVECSVTLNDHKERAENMWQPAAPQIQTGNAEVRGRIILEIREINTQELMWIKTIPFENFTFPYFVKASYEEYARIKATGSNKLYSYDPIFNGMARGLEEQYHDIMSDIDNLIDPEEMSIIKKQCQEIKNKKGY